MAGTNSKPDVSLVVCTRNRCEQLVPCLETIQHIEFERPWELIVVNNGSDDATALIVQEFTKAASFTVHHVTEPKLGLGHARNAGVAAASGEILTFTDDDCYPAPDFLSRVWAAFRDPSLGYVTGRILLHDPSDLALAIQDYNVPVTFPGKSFIHPGGVQGANMPFDVMFFIKLVVLTRYSARDLYFPPKIWTPRTERVPPAGKVSIVPISLSITITGVSRRMLHVCGSPMGLASAPVT